MRLVLYLPLFLVAFFTVYASADEQQQLGLENRFRRARDATMDWIASHNLKMPFGKTKREAVATETDKKADKQEQVIVKNFDQRIFICQK
jgi:hypothetical protein